MCSSCGHGEASLWMRRDSQRRAVQVLGEWATALLEALRRALPRSVELSLLGYRWVSLQGDECVVSTTVHLGSPSFRCPPLPAMFSYTKEGKSYNLSCLWLPLAQEQLWQLFGCSAEFLQTSQNTQSISDCLSVDCSCMNTSSQPDFTSPLLLSCTNCFPRAIQNRAHLGGKEISVLQNPAVTRWTIPLNDECSRYLIYSGRS